MTELNDKTIDFLETKFPELMKVATYQAYFQTLAAGISVTVLLDGKIIEIFPDGTSKVIKVLFSNTNSKNEK
jgi:hypothetical protein